MKILFLLPPSEGKNSGGEYSEEKLSFPFKKPIEIAINATEKDLKCSGNRYQEGINLNKQLVASSLPGGENGEGAVEAVKRYSGVMYNAINYENMTKNGKQFFEENFLILSGMYGITTPIDIIGNYKLPIDTKGLYKFWGEKITDIINEMNPEYIVNLLPGAYLKMIDLKKLKCGIININFLREEKGKIVKISHGVKKIKGEWIKKICEAGEKDFNNFGGKVVQSGNVIDINIF